MFQKKEPEPTEERKLELVAELRTALGEQKGRAAIFCSDDCLHRYLRARSWNLAKAEKMLRDTLKWREEYKPEEITWGQICKEAETGKIYRTNFFDKKGRSVLVVAPGRQNTKNHDMHVKHLVYCLENAIIALPPGQEQMVWIMDYRGWTFMMTPAMKTSRETLSILQNHYPERLGAALAYDPPAIFEAFWTLIKPFVDPITSKKIRFLSSKHASTRQQLEEFFDMDKLEKSFGGRSEWSFNYEDYCKMMIEDDKKMAEHWQIGPKAV